MSLLISHWRGVHISFELCCIYKHKPDACVKMFVTLVLRLLKCFPVRIHLRVEQNLFQIDC